MRNETGKNNGRYDKKDDKTRRGKSRRKQTETEKQYRKPKKRKTAPKNEIFSRTKKNEIPKISTDEAKEHLRGSGKANSNAELQAAQSNVDTIIVKMARPRRGNVAAAFFI